MVTVHDKDPDLYIILITDVDAISLHSVADRHRFDAEPDPNFHVDSDLDPDPDWHQNDADPQAGPTPSCTLEKSDFFITFSNSFVSLLPVCFFSLISVPDVIILSILDSILKF
jgi:hypothetical protein